MNNKNKELVNNSLEVSNDVYKTMLTTILARVSNVNTPIINVRVMPSNLGGNFWRDLNDSTHSAVKIGEV